MKASVERVVHDLNRRIGFLAKEEQEEVLDALQLAINQGVIPTPATRVDDAVAKLLSVYLEQGQQDRYNMRLRVEQLLAQHLAT